jgi:hypothetical protein
MWGAIVQAIDHAMGRMNEGMGSGIKVAESQGGGGSGAAMAKPASGANLASVAKNIASIKDEKSSEDKATEEAKKAAEDAKEAEKAEETGKAEDATIISDCRLKELFGTDDIVKLFSHINSYEFKYTPKALRLYNGTKGVDEGTNIGVMAQELEENPVTENTVIDDENGYKNIETNKLAAADTAVLADVCKRLIAIEEKLGLSKE